MSIYDKNQWKRGLKNALQKFFTRASWFPVPSGGILVRLLGSRDKNWKMDNLKIVKKKKMAVTFKLRKIERIPKIPLEFLCLKT